MLANVLVAYYGILMANGRDNDETPHFTPRSTVVANVLCMNWLLFTKVRFHMCNIFII